MQKISFKALLGLSVVTAIAGPVRVASAQQNTGYVEYVFAGTASQGSGICMGVSGGSMNNGTYIKSWPCNAEPSNNYTGARDQAWTFNPNDTITYGGYTYYSLRNGLNYNKCLAVGNGGSTVSGTVLVIWDCLGQGHHDQYWNSSVGSDGFLHFTNLASAEHLGWYGVHYNGSMQVFTLAGGMANMTMYVAP